MNDFKNRPDGMISPNTVTKGEADLLQIYRALGGPEQKEIMDHCKSLLAARLKSSGIR